MILHKSSINMRIRPKKRRSSSGVMQVQTFPQAAEIPTTFVYSVLTLAA